MKLAPCVVFLLWQFQLSVNASEPDLSAIYTQAVKSCAVLVVKDGDRRQLYPTICLDVERKLFMASLEAVQDERQTAMVFPSYDKEGKLITKAEEYLQAAADMTWSRGKDLVTARDEKRRLAVLTAPAISRGTVAMPLAAESPREGDSAVCVLVGPSRGYPVFGDCWVKVHKRWELTVPRKDLGDEQITVRGWSRPAIDFIATSGIPFVDIHGHLTGIMPDRRIVGAQGSAAGIEVLDVMELRKALEELKIKLIEKKGITSPGK